MTEANKADERAPWTIKAIRVELRDAAVRGARAQGVTMGEWMERAIPRQLEADAGNRVIPPGQPGQSVALAEPMGRLEPVAHPEPHGRAVDLAGLAEVMRASVTLAQAAELPGMKGLARSAAALVREGIREARGLPQPAPRRKPPAAVKG